MVDARLVQTLLVDESHTDNAFQRLGWQKGELSVAVFDYTVSGEEIRFNTIKNPALFNLPMHSDQSRLRRRASALRQSQHSLLVVNVLPKQPNPVLVRNDMRHRLQKQLRRPTSFLQIPNERRHFDIPDQPMPGGSVVPPAISAVQQH